MGCPHWATCRTLLVDGASLGQWGGLHPWRHPQPGRGLGPLALGDTAGAAPGAGNPQRSPSSNAVFNPQRERFCHQKGAICDQNS